MQFLQLLLVLNKSKIFYILLNIYWYNRLRPERLGISLCSIRLFPVIRFCFLPWLSCRNFIRNIETFSKEDFASDDHLFFFFQQEYIRFPRTAFVYGQHIILKGLVLKQNFQFLYGPGFQFLDGIYLRGSVVII